MNELIRMIEEARRIAVFTGAGVSTLSGIPDFRGPQGIYRTMDADRIFAIDQFDADPSFYYGHARDFIYGLGDHQPSVVHRVCAEWGRQGRVIGVITQNIDMLHQRAGSTSVIELHGSPEFHSCRRCGGKSPFSEVVPVVRAGEVPSCDACGGILKPDITFFGEMLPAGALEKACEIAAQADLMLVLGSSLVVQPAASVPAVTAQHGGRLAVINLDPTYLDDHADYRGADLAAEFAPLAAHFEVQSGDFGPKHQ